MYRPRPSSESPLLNRPVFRRSLQVEVIDDREVILLSEREHYALTGTAFAALAELLKEPHSVVDLVEAAEPRASEAEVFYALERLEALGVIREAGDALPPSTEGYWDALGVSPADAVHRIAEAKVNVIGVGGVSTSHLEEALCVAGVQVTDRAELLIVLTGDYLAADLAAINATRLREGQPWLISRPVGSRLWIGPMMRPGETGCWECLADRLRLHRVAEKYVQTRNGGVAPRPPANYALPSTAMLAASLIATEVAKWLAGAPGNQLETSLLTIDLSTLVTGRHAFIRRPQCAACGEPGSSSRPPAPLRLISRKKQYTEDGGHRVAAPAETLARYVHHVSPLTGIVKELSLSTPDATVAPVYISGPNASRNDDVADLVHVRFRGSSAGKGKSESQAKASALCEALERHSGVFEGNEIRRRATFQSLGDAAIHPNACMGYSARQYALRPEAPAARHRRVPVPFDEGAAIEWSPLWSMTEERFKYLPTAYCYYSYPLPAHERFCWADSNGCAAGNSYEEAVLQGFLELVERDSVAIWWYNRLPRPAVDLSSFNDPYFETLQRYYRDLGREIWVLDITSDLGIPTFAAMSRRTGEGPEEIILGFGAHLRAGVAVLRAVTEANQSLPMIIGRKNGSAPRGDEDFSSWLRTATIANQPFLRPSSARPLQERDYTNQDHDDLKDDVEACVRIAAARGLDTLVLDQTRPDVGLTVVRVVVPGLRHFWARFGPGRLYDVPVERGWLAAPLHEQELNPIPIFF